MENHPSREVLSADDLMKVSWKMFRERIFKFLYIFLLSIVLFLFSATILFSCALFSGNPLVILLTLLAVFLSILAIALIQNLMFFEVIRNKHIRIRQAFRRAVARLRPYVGSLTLYLLVASNLIVLVAFLGLFVFLSAVFMTLISYVQAASFLFGMMAAFLIFFVSLILTVLTVFAYAWQYFFFFDVVLHGMRVREALDHAFFLINKNKQDVFEKCGLFLLFFAVTLLTLWVISTFAPALGFIVEIGNYVLGAWAIVYLYAMFEDIKEANPGKADAVDRSAVSLLLKSGSVIALTFAFLLCFSLAFSIAQLEDYDTAAPAHRPVGEVITAVDNL